ncbi:hypothetical protein EDB85DRAFT_1998462 [Lactarius pseudohatsudake]|nr:hypothetical protein EDB85DRAFT_1998462 [Lactarius pseudohatsudake]
MATGSANLIRVSACEFNHPLFIIFLGLGRATMATYLGKVFSGQRAGGSDSGINATRVKRRSIAIDPRQWCDVVHVRWRLLCQCSHKLVVAQKVAGWPGSRHLRLASGGMAVTGAVALMCL